MTAESVLNERIDDLLHLLEARGHSSRIEVIRRAIFALPTDDEEHLGRLMQFGGLRWREANGLGWNAEALAECEGLLGWFNEDADRAALVKELDDLRSRLQRIVRGLDEARAVAAMEHAEWWR